MSEIDIIKNKEYLYRVIEFIKLKSFYSMDIIIEVLSAYECCVEDDINESPIGTYNCINEITGLNIDTIKKIMNLLTEYHGNLL